METASPSLYPPLSQESRTARISEAAAAKDGKKEAKKKNRE